MWHKLHFTYELIWTEDNLKQMRKHLDGNALWWKKPNGKDKSKHPLFWVQTGSSIMMGRNRSSYRSERLNPNSPLFVFQSAALCDEWNVNKCCGPCRGTKKEGERKRQTETLHLSHTHTQTDTSTFLFPKHTCTHKYPHAQEITGMEKSSTVNILQTDCFLKQTYTFTHTNNHTNILQEDQSASQLRLCVLQ